LLFGLSLVVLIVYFSESFQKIEGQTWLKFFHLQLFLGATRLALVFIGLIVDGVFQGIYVFSAIGLFLWYMMYQQIKID
jgi:hypothetical protein